MLTTNRKNTKSIKNKIVVVLLPITGQYIKPEGKNYKQISLSELELQRHNNNWIQRAGA